MERGVTIAHANQTDTTDYFNNPVRLNRNITALQSKQESAHSVALWALSLLFFLYFKFVTTFKRSTEDAMI